MAMAHQYCFVPALSPVTISPRASINVLPRKACSWTPDVRGDQLAAKLARASSRRAIFRRQAPRAANDMPRRRGAQAAGFGRFLRRNDGSFFDDADVSRLPSYETSCACGSGLSYGKCCRRFHTNTSSPGAAVDLLRSRYSAYAYRLPAYIMRTTHRTTAELDRMNWRKEIMEFCTEYRFCDGVEVIEQNVTSADTTTILFRASMRRRNAPVSLMELGRFVRDNNQWYYVDGKLVDFDDNG